MQNVELAVTERPSLAPDLLCEWLGPFDRADLASVRRAFQSATPVSFRQAWLVEEAAGFSPAVVRLGWRDNALLVFAELTDADIFSDVTGLNQRTWELGDVFEMFVGTAERERYVEFHVTPNNQRLQLRYPDAGAAKWARATGKSGEFLVPGQAFHSRTWIEAGMGQWRVYAEIPAGAVCGSEESIEGRQWRFSFGRYDYTRGVKEPVISCTSPLTAPDFHRRHEWRVMTFKARL
jgi:hypothetical protein